MPSALTFHTHQRLLSATLPDAFTSAISDLRGPLSHKHGGPGVTQGEAPEGQLSAVRDKHPKLL